MRPSIAFGVLRCAAAAEGCRVLALLRRLAADEELAWQAVRMAGESRGVKDEIDWEELIAAILVLVELFLKIFG